MVFRGVHMYNPPFFEGAWPHALLFLLGCHFWLAALKGIKPSLHSQCRYLSVGRSILHQSGRLWLSILTWGLLSHFTPPSVLFGWPCLPWPSSVSGSNPLLVHYPPVSMGIDIVPLPYICVPPEVCSQITLPVFLHMSSVDAPVDIYGPSCNFLFFHPREALLVGHQVTALPSCSCSIISSSPPKVGSLAWGGTGTPVPCMMAAHTQENTNLWCNEKKPVLVEDSWPSVLVRHFVGGHFSHDLLWHLPSLFILHILDLPLSLPGIHLH